MRIVFAGTPEFAVPALSALLASEHEVALVLTQPDRPAGRGRKLMASPVKRLALEHDVPIHQPESLKAEQARKPIADVAPDLMVVAAYGLILPQSVLDIPSRGCWNIHGSLLPRWRGAAPVQRAILAGDVETGVNLMQMEAGLDTGPVLAEQRTPIHRTDTAATLTTRLAHLGAVVLTEALSNPAGLSPTTQDESRATYAHKIDKAEAQLDWDRDAVELDRAIRAFNPFPGVRLDLDGEEVKVWAAQPAPGEGEPGEILDVSSDGIVIAASRGAIRITELQRPGSRRMSARDYLNARALKRA